MTEKQAANLIAKAEKYADTGKRFKRDDGTEAVVLDYAAAFGYLAGSLRMVALGFGE